MLIIDSGEAASDSSFFLASALRIGKAPAFQVEVVPASRVTPAMLDRRTVVILNDTISRSACRATR